MLNLLENASFISSFTGEEIKLKEKEKHYQDHLQIKMYNCPQKGCDVKNIGQLKELREHLLRHC
jgi:hypothetical protein